MAGDWIKMRVGLTTSPRVMRIAECLLEDGKFLEWSGLSFGMQGYPPQKEAEARAERHSALRVTRYVTVTALLKFWGYANEHVKGEVIAGIYPEDIDEIVGVPGFAEAIESAGWVVFDAAGGLTMPNFAEHNTSAGERSSGAERQKRYRERAKGGEAGVNVKSDVTRNVTVTPREEKRREESLRASLSLPTDAGASGSTVLVTDGDGNPMPPADNAQAIGVGVPAAKRLRAIGIRVTALDPTLLALCAEKFSVEEMVLMASEQVLRKAHLWNDSEVHPDLPELLASAATQQQMLLTGAQYATVQTAAAEIGIAYLATALRGRRQDAIDNQSPPRRATTKNAARKPSATDNFEGKKYVGTPIEQLPPEFRDGLDQALAGNG